MCAVTLSVLELELPNLWYDNVPQGAESVNGIRATPNIASTIQPYTEYLPNCSATVSGE